MQKNTEQAHASRGAQNCLSSAIYQQSLRKRRNESTGPGRTGAIAIQMSIISGTARESASTARSAKDTG